MCWILFTLDKVTPCIGPIHQAPSGSQVPAHLCYLIESTHHRGLAALTHPHFTDEKIGSQGGLGDLVKVP